MKKINRIILLVMMICLPTGLCAQGTISRPKKPSKQTVSPSKKQKKKPRKQTQTNAVEKPRKQTQTNAVKDESTVLEEYPNSTFANLRLFSPDYDNREFRINLMCDWKVHPNPETVKKLEFTVLWVGGNWSSPINSEEWTMTRENPWFVERRQSDDSKTISFIDPKSRKKIEIYIKKPSLKSTLRIYDGGNSPLRIFPIKVTERTLPLFDQFISRIIGLGYVVER